MPLCLSFHPDTLTHTWCLGADCVRMISTISANCDVAFCALTVIIADFTDLHTTLPFPTSLLLLTYSLLPLLIRADRGLSTASSVSSHCKLCVSVCVCAPAEPSQSIKQFINQSISQSVNQAVSSQAVRQAVHPSVHGPHPWVLLCCLEPKWRLCFVILLLVHRVLNTIALNAGSPVSHAASPACGCNP